MSAHGHGTTPLFDAAEQAIADARFPRTIVNIRAFERGWCAAAMSRIAQHPGSDYAKVRLALEEEYRGWPISPTVKRVFAKGVRAKLAHLRTAGVIP